MSEVDERQSPGNDVRDRRSLSRRPAVIVGAAVLMIGIATLTGVPGPGPLRRYALGDLQAVAAKINALSRDPNCTWASVNQATSRVDSGVEPESSDLGPLR